MDKTMNQDQAVQMAGQYLPLIATAIQSGFEDYQTTLRALGTEGINPNLKTRTSASLIHDFIQEHVRREFANHANVRADEFNGIFGILVAGKIFVRFKKLKPDLNTSNVKTEQVNQFNKQQLRMDGIEDLTLLTAGYIPNPTWTSIQSICLTCKHGENILWYKDLHFEASQIPMFSTNTSSRQAQSSSEQPNVRLKTKDLGSKAANE